MAAAVGHAGQGQDVLAALLMDDADNVDLVVLNAAEEWTVDPEQFHSKARNTPFGGWQVTGRPLATIIGSQLMFSRL